MKITVRKSDGERVYHLPSDVQAGTIMQALDYIYEHLDHSLAYFRHSACCQGVCARCLLKANGKTVLACVEKLNPEAQELYLEPAGKQVVRDLVCK